MLRMTWQKSRGKSVSSPAGGSATEISLLVQISDTVSPTEKRFSHLCPEVDPDFQHDIGRPSS